MEIRAIAGTEVSAVGFSAEQLSLQERPDEAQGLRTLHAALDAGVTLLDTAHAYGLDAEDAGHGEALVAKALAQWGGDADDVLVATKGGRFRGEDGSWATDGRPERLRQDCEASLKALGRSWLGLYQLHRPDPDVPLAESVGALRELQDAGKIGLIGVCHVNVDAIGEAQTAADLASVANELSPDHRSEAELEECAMAGIAFLCHRPLRGVEQGAATEASQSAFVDVAGERDATPAQVAVAWLLAKAPVTVPLPAARSPQDVQEAVAGAELELVPDELARLDEEF